jgi:hypothetical protein
MQMYVILYVCMYINVCVYIYIHIRTYIQYTYIVRILFVTRCAIRSARAGTARARWGRPARRRPARSARRGTSPRGCLGALPERDYGYSSVLCGTRGFSRVLQGYPRDCSLRRPRAVSRAFFARCWSDSTLAYDRRSLGYHRGTLRVR